MTFDLLIHGAAQVLTCTGDVRGPAEAALAPVADGAVGIVGAQVAWVGRLDALPPGAVGPGTQHLDAQGGLVVPGLVDCHTHLVWAGSRADELESRLRGETYLDIARRGGGIQRTMRATGQASHDVLLASALERLERLAAQGVTCVEVKTGYGDSVEAELRQLAVIEALARQSRGVTVVPTLLPLHAVPRGLQAEAWVEAVVTELLPQAVGRVRFVDAFVEAQAFDGAQARRLGEAARAFGMRLRLHVDQLTAGAGGAQLAASLGAHTADHLEQVDEAGIAALARAGTIAVLAPTSTLFAQARPYAPGRALREAGVPVAVCTNSNPGSSPSENVALALGLACLENRLTPAEALLGFTRVAALALAQPQRGLLAPGAAADVALFDVASYLELPYFLAMPRCRAVVAGGRLRASKVT